MCFLLKTSKKLEDCLSNFFFWNHWGYGILGTYGGGLSRGNLDFSTPLWDFLLVWSSHFSFGEFEGSTIFFAFCNGSLNYFPLCKVMSLTCSFVFISVLLGKDICGLALSILEICPTWTFKFIIDVAWLAISSLWRVVYVLPISWLVFKFN